ncbi:hypothetical protein OBBRIDRAFT_763985 [Obba rivulosa]|uniref:Alpha/beta-hydrolase n=1 Tax=Obba rivulosa TaxID=1052685 RepID=A0A8E2DJE7_9APHY|nr:hypothetical protein OBBRIDRAFT_763985 [Obba rivulosa]
MDPGLHSSKINTGSPGKVETPSLKWQDEAGKADKEVVPAGALLSSEHWWVLQRRQVIIILLGIVLLVFWNGLPQSPFGPCNQPSTSPAYVHLDIGEVVWAKCTGEYDLPRAECGSILVPLDYFNSSAGVAKIALGRYNATSGPRKGIVLVNPGGPGGPGKRLATISGHTLQQLIGPEYDVIGFDPRGIGETQPRTQCFPSQADYLAFKSHTVLERGYDVGPNLTVPGNREHLIALQREADALLKTQFEICGETMGEELRYMGTSTVVRDMDFITAVLEGDDALINYWGGSYGSILGQYLVNMLPDRVGRVTIDGIADAVAWSNQPYYQWYGQWLSSTQDAYNIFASECSKVGPDICALAAMRGEDPAFIVERIEGFVAKLYDEPLPVPDATRPGILTSGLLRQYILEHLEAPLSWPDFARDFASAMQGNGTAILSTLQIIPSYFYDLARSAVSCNDNKPFAPPSAEEVIDKLLNVERKVAPFAFAAVTTEPDAGCQFWPVQPPERFDGPWNHTLRNPILVVSNTADPITPIASGQLVIALMPNSSRLLVQDSPGHCSLALPSLCTVKHVRAYFRDGSLPPEGTICQPSVTPFGISEAGSVLSGEDHDIIESLKELGRVFAKVRAEG